MLGANNVQIGTIYGDLCGRDFTIEQQTIAVTLPEGEGETTGYIFVEIDTSAETPLSVGSALAPFTPTYEDINVNGAVAQMIIAEYTASAVAVTSITAKYSRVSAGGIGSLAMIESSPATANHSAGSYLVYDGVLYKVRSAIAAGETLVPGTNITATTAGAELTSLNNGLSHKQNTLTITSLTSTAVGSGVTINSQSLALYGKVLQFSIDVTLASQISQYGNLVSLGGKSAAAGWCYPLFSAGFVPSSQYAIYGDLGNQNIRVAQTLPAGRYRLIGMVLVV
jgi:hypothetical protein